MIRSRHGNLARALSASAAAGALMLAVSGGAGAQSAAPDKPASTSKKQATDTRKQKLAPALAPGAYAMVTKGPALPSVVPAWTGLYGGVSFGTGPFKANASTVFHSVNTQNIAFPTGALRTITTIEDTLSGANGRNWGALSDVYVGYNFRPAGNVIAGVQVEGTIANERAQLDGSSARLVNATTVTTPPGSTSSSSTLTTSTIRDNLAERWAVAALGRLGVLLTPRDLAYVIGGYTYGGFEWNGRSFGLNGATVGAGWEHEIAPSWTFKAEYRYTAFEDKDLSRPANFSAAQAEVFAGATTTTITNFTSATTDRASGIALHALRLGITHYFDGGPAAPVPYAMVTKAPPVVASPWEGPYAGVSYGPAWISAATSTASNSTSTRVVTSPTGAVTTSTTTANLVGAGSGNNTGAVSDVFLGYNFRLGGNVIAGLQVEGTVADVDAALTTTQVQTTNATTFTDVTSVTFLDQFAQRWAISALGRLGVLLDPQNLVYGIGGYTRGGFEWDNRTFGLNGATVGAGWEHEIAPTWTLKAEYRYTAFEDKDLPRSTASSSTQRSVSTTGAVTTTVTDTATAINNRISDVKLHALRFGITHYFSAGEPVVGAYAMATKAPPLPVPAFTGLYGGVSFGLMSMRAKAESITNEVFNVTETAPGVVVTDVQALNTVSNASGRHGGAVADVLIGYNVPIGPMLIGGVQLEGSLAHGAVLANGSFAETFSDNFVQTGLGGPDVTTGTASGTRSVDVQSRWMVSALARLGVLVDPRDLIYAIGGWSYGGFTTGAFTTGLHPFNLNGPTVGVGIEREVAPTWTLRAEYRYTHFLPRNVTAVQTQIENETAGTIALTATDTFTETDRISVDMHTVRFGIAHYFAAR